MDKIAATFKAGGAMARRGAFILLAGAAFAAAAAPAARAAPVRAAVFAFELDDTSLGATVAGAHPEQARLARLDAQLRAALTQSGRYELVDVAPVAQQEAATSLRQCDTCAVDLARKLGAQVAVNGWVQKVSELILNINLVVRDVDSGKMLSAGSVDIRGNTDESWTRGLAYLLKHRILVDGTP